MPEYYKLSLLRRTRDGADWEEIYLEINGQKSRVIAHLPDSEQVRLLNSKLEKISGKEAMKKFYESH